MTKRFRFDKQLVLITGGSSGIGFAVARALLQEGADLYILARRLELLTSTILVLKKERIRPEQKIGLISLDVANENDVTSILGKFIQKVGVPDIVINSAGIVTPGAVTELSTSAFHRMMDTNFFGTVNVSKTLIPPMIERGYGHIVNISSFVGFFASYGYAAYAASKFAVRGFSDVIRAELKPDGINVSVVFPADTDTPQLREERKSQSELMQIINSTAGMMSADKVAKAIANGIYRKHYIITPGFEATFAYYLSILAGYLQYPLMDNIISGARKKLKAKK
jgi:3-dehydrosphinganine reductase